MKYAKYISETQINAIIPKKGYDAEGRLVTGNLTNRPDVLKLMDFYPLSETPMPQETIDGYHYEKRYSPPENDTIVQTWISVEDPQPIPSTKVYSKLKILIAADEANIIDPLMDFIESDRKIQFIWDASNTIEDNALLGQYIETIGTALGKTEEEIMSFLDSNCLID